MKDLPKTYIKKFIGDIEDPIILDIGCYDGKDSKEIISHFKGGIVHCFDADKRSQDLLLAISGDEERMILWRYAVCNVDGEIEFHLSDSETRRHYEAQKSWSASSSIRKPKYHLELFPDVKFEKTTTVRAIKLDTWFNKFYDIDKRIDFAWVDVNGAEEDFVLGALKTLNNFTRYLYIETSDKECYEGEIKRDALLKLLPNFEVIGIYKDEGNFGNVLLKNKIL